MIFVDTSAFLAIVKVDDIHHQSAKQQWITLLDSNEILYTNNYIVLESISIIQKRSGIKVLQKLQSNFLSLVRIDWINEERHSDALKSVLEANRRKLSLVDCAAFQSMRRLGIETAFTFDKHFSEEGFKIVP
jgi:predicted nucleic acid-binding protein